ncbi:alpha/beta-hydrolase [Mollisia scopiformis]|uniref:Alpha/beta-hydrolase n=1 Tax=Mollisia scopiformis TaxID=149040 RepID=A0A132BDN8_MOLSC|nr:alpha/beta-hydrolase [Mollisia scopiformis]KUJ10501.1 alpha/beta-hydrolase [Mollisia scopiformis]
MSHFKVGSVEVHQRPTQRLSDPPKEPETLELYQGHKRGPQYRSLPCDIILDRNFVLTLRDGTKIRTDIFRAKTEEKSPAIVMWGPYGKSGDGVLNLKVFSHRAGVPQECLSGYDSFEGVRLDPAEWVPKGFTIVNVNARGAGDSEGDLRWWGTAEGRDGYDAIEEVAKLPWCNGKVAMAGNSWLAMVQWFVAAEQPPHLVCIAPLEGSGDPYREDCFRGGVPRFAFSTIVGGMLQGRGQQEDITAMNKLNPNSSEYWEDKRADMSKINVPAYILGSFSTSIHTLGSIRGFEEIPHLEKWLTIHATQEWYDLYSEERTTDLHKFFDYYLKGAQNEWPTTPKVRYALLNYTEPAYVNLPFPDLPWNLPLAHSQRLYLSANHTLSETPMQESAVLKYSADSAKNDGLAFEHTFNSKTILVGPSSLVISIASPSHNDMDIYTRIRKASPGGDFLYHQNIPLPQGAEVPETSVFRYLGPSGMLRASRWHISSELSTKNWKVLSNNNPEPVAPGQTIRLEIMLWPTGIVFEPGEKMVLEITGQDSGLTDFPIPPEMIVNGNVGEHHVSVGSGEESYLEFSTIALGYES